MEFVELREILLGDPALDEYPVFSGIAETK
jgi:hypothetical protein